MTPYNQGFSDAEYGIDFDFNPYDYWLSHDKWLAWNDGWRAYRRNNGTNIQN